MTAQKSFDVIITGGSYAGLSAAMALGRSLRQVLILDSGLPCNRQTPHSHNFITQDGQTPKEIAEKAKAQVMQYDTVHFRAGLAVEALPTKNGFEVKTQEGETFTASKLLFATGIKDIMPAIKGFAECWGISVLHCPYCHGYEVRHQNTGIISNGDFGFEYGRLISNWTNKLTLFTNGKSTLTSEQTEKLASHHITIVEKEIAALEHTNGRISHIVFRDGSQTPVDAVYSRPGFEQHCPIPAAMGCELTEHGFIKTDQLQRTTVRGVYAAGDNSNMMRSVSAAVAAGTTAGAAINRELIEDAF